ncbi:MAG: hypothetical protein RLZZ182_2221 [Pseudomonadota bacterium]|jgi:hypothetical protein
MAKAGYMLDMKADGFGVVRVAYHATAVFADPLTDKLHLVLDEDDEPATAYLPLPSTAPIVSGLDIYEFNAEDGDGHVVYQWKGKLNLLRRETAFIYCQVKAEEFDNLLLRLYADGEMLLEIQVTDEEPFTLPLDDSYTMFEVEMMGTSRVYSVRVAESEDELEEDG